MVPFPFPSWDLDDLDDLEANLESASAVGGVSSSMPSARFVRSNLTSARQTYSEQLQPLPFRLPPLDLELMNSPIKEASREFSVGGVSNHTFTHNTVDHTMEKLFEHQQQQYEKQQQENEEEEKEQREEEKESVTQPKQENAKDYANEDEKASKSEVSDEKTIILPPMTLPPLARPGLVTAPREPIIVKLKRAVRKARAEQKEDEPPSIFRALRAALAKRENNDDVQFLSGLVVRRKEVKHFYFIYSIKFLFKCFNIFKLILKIFFSMKGDASPQVAAAPPPPPPNVEGHLVARQHSYFHSHRNNDEPYANAHRHRHHVCALQPTRNDRHCRLGVRAV